MQPTVQKLTQLLNQQIERSSDLELRLDCLRAFKREQIHHIENQDKTALLSPIQVFEKLSYLAEAIVLVALKMAEEELSKTYGYPTFISNQGEKMESEFVILGMGKLGGREIHYGSDLDLIFLFSRNGQTEGRQEITNQEYYGKLVQKLIHYLGVYTRQGIAYKIDTQLRPSGNQGMLVCTLDAFAQYHRDRAQFWEKQALLKTRVISPPNTLTQKFDEQLLTLIFINPFPADLNEKIHAMRLKMQQEIARETQRRIHYKLGEGGIADIEFCVQYLQLKMGKIFPFIVCQNTLEALKKMQQEEILKGNQYAVLSESYLFYRTLEMRLETFFDLHNGYLDPETPLLENIAEVMAEESGKTLIARLLEARKQVREIYLKILQVDPRLRGGDGSLV